MDLNLIKLLKQIKSLIGYYFLYKIRDFNIALEEIEDLMPSCKGELI